MTAQIIDDDRLVIDGSRQEQGVLIYNINQQIFQSIEIVNFLRDTNDKLLEDCLRMLSMIKVKCNQLFLRNVIFRKESCVEFYITIQVSSPNDLLEMKDIIFADNDAVLDLSDIYYFWRIKEIRYINWRFKNNDQLPHLFRKIGENPIVERHTFHLSTVLTKQAIKELGKIIKGASTPEVLVFGPNCFNRLSVVEMIKWLPLKHKSLRELVINKKNIKDKKEIDQLGECLLDSEHLTKLIIS